ncbi:hypothetical protein [Terrimonas sp.]|uniref:hypothetical protein n=1 Tax=Terrimonas sp. TaxID=1914338 RepID=UPI001057122C|nr:hypothetical protein [Terrimonas sp.]
MLETLKTYTVDILAVLVPGALLLVVLYQIPEVREATNSVVLPEILKVKKVELVCFLVTSYVAGQFAFFFGSFLDKVVYEPYMKRYMQHHNGLQRKVIKIKDKLTGITTPQELNAFKWSCAWLIANKPELYNEVERFIAESKLFRSLVMVFLIASVIFSVYPGKCHFACFSVLLLIFSLIRYITRRVKSIESAYRAVVTAMPGEFSVTIPQKADNNDDQ